MQLACKQGNKKWNGGEPQNSGFNLFWFIDFFHLTSAVSFQSHYFSAFF